ncbi:MAG: GTP cyclohydrolase II [Saprospiraceae bacterium]|nr:GTP cyclohydrolase II [Saprospiraceae bacterium]
MKKQAEALIPTPWGNFVMMAFSDKEEEWMPHLVMVHEHMDTDSAVLTRIHSECITGDLFGSKRCDCGEQLDKALEMTARQKGIVLYLRQEGRGIGIINKLKAYNLQDLGLNTVDANLHLGLEVDARQYDIALQMLRALGVSAIRLLTNNPEKVEAFENSDIQIVERVPLVVEPHDINRNYLRAKQRHLGHLFDRSKH